MISNLLQKPANASIPVYENKVMEKVIAEIHNLHT